jgi:hypothetical protein
VHAASDRGVGGSNPSMPVLSSGKEMKTYLVALVALLVIGGVYAHEVYVLDDATIRSGFGTRGINVFDALSDSRNANMFLVGAGFMLVGFILLSYLIHTKLSKATDEQLKKVRKYAHLIIRIGLGISFAWGAYHNSIFGPEVPLASIPGGMIWKPVLFTVGIMLIFGAFTRIAAVIALLSFIVVTFDRGWYMMNYLNYLGEITVLVLERGELFSIDRLVKWKSHLFHHKFPHWFEKLEQLGEKYSFPIIRISFGIALIWAAMSVKILYPALSLDVLHNFGLDTREALAPLFIVLAAGIIEIWLGLVLITGFLYRFHMLVLVFFVGYSVWFFGEAVWPHAILVGLAIGLFLHGTDKYCIEDKIYKVLWGWTKRFRKNKNVLSPE